MSRPVYVVDGARTPFLGRRGTPGPLAALDLALHCGRPLLDRLDLARDAVDRAILGSVLARDANPARTAALRLGLDPAIAALTVRSGCVSGLAAIGAAFQAIRAGDADLVLAGGADAPSRAALPRQGPLAALRGRNGSSPTAEGARSAEILAHLFAVSREAADDYAAESRRRLAAARREGRLAREIEPIFARDGAVHADDDASEADPESLAALPPTAEPPWGKITAGNAAPSADGACWLALASEEALEAHRLTPRAVLRAAAWAGLEPDAAGLGPTVAATALLTGAGLGFDEVELWELDEPFAASVLACVAAWGDADYCRGVLGLDAASGRLAPDRLNVDGGALALGRPPGAAGARLVLHLVEALRHEGARYGVAAASGGRGEAGALLLERI
jgi:acetyl-CoA C-acetyltransferase